MSIVKLLDDYGFDYVQDSGHKHARPGWVNINDCPFCTGNPGYHLGFNYEEGYFRCWRCGSKKTYQTIAKLLRISMQDAIALTREYKIYSNPLRREKKSDVGLKPHILPSDVGAMTSRHKKYLEKRNFDPHYIENEWGVLGTGPASMLDDSYYNHRILAPIWWQGRQVSFQARDITNKQELKYKACPKQRELVHHKRILYGKPWKWQDVGICTEGIFDVWRLGVLAFATFGIEYTLAQLKVIKNNFAFVVILFDADPQAVQKAKQLKFALQELGGDAVIEPIQDDPASLKQEEANYIVKKILKYSSHEKHTI